ncbi:hypothetical protein C3L33_17510, partial [Rhododendron williamsianum]
MAAISVSETLGIAPKIIGSVEPSDTFSIIDHSAKIDLDDPDANPFDSIHAEIDHSSKIDPDDPDANPVDSDPSRPKPSPRRTKWGRKECRDLVNRTILRPFGRNGRKNQLASILDNIAYGKDGANKAEVTEAARVANVHAFISGLSKGYNTPVGEGDLLKAKTENCHRTGSLKDLAILLLDEATKALDAEPPSVCYKRRVFVTRGA